MTNWFIILIFVLLELISSAFVSAQSTGYWVWLKDKPDVAFQPDQFFHPKALERRQIHALPLCDSSDFPVHPSYIAQLSNLVDTVLYASRWFNAVALRMNSQQLAAVQQLPFVRSVVPTKRMRVTPAEFRQVAYPPTDSTNKKTLLRMQTQRMQADAFHVKGLYGRGVRIAVFDLGFTGVDKREEFKSLIAERRIVGTRDFVSGKDFKYGYSHHGTLVLSCLTGNYKGQAIGMAQQAEYLLARTEYALLESIDEEFHWIAALEWADQQGADIVNSSLNYTDARYEYANMNGQYAMISMAANAAMRKGILVVNSAGNEGNKAWQYVGAPADADSVLTVGAIDPYTDLIANYSSVGPTFDKRLKPNVCAYGNVITGGSHQIHQHFGTSFAAPLVTGFAACLKQHMPQATAWQLFERIQQSGHLYPYFDYSHGYGVPLARKALGLPSALGTKPFSIDDYGNMVAVVLQKPPDPKQTTYLFYHIANADDVLIKYAVIRAENQIILSIDKSVLAKNYKLRVHYEGFSETYFLSF
jgi:serine protease AprX